METAMPAPDSGSPRKLSAGYRRRAVISLTPLIDVVFILLVFFMLASSFLDWRTIELNVATPGNPGPVGEADKFLISVHRDGLALNGERLAREKLLVMASDYMAVHPDRQLRIRPVADAPLQAVVRLMDSLQAAGITRLILARDPAWREAMESGAPQEPR